MRTFRVEASAWLTVKLEADEVLEAAQSAPAEGRHGTYGLPGGGRLSREGLELACRTWAEARGQRGIPPRAEFREGPSAHPGAEPCPRLPDWVSFSWSVRGRPDRPPRPGPAAELDAAVSELESGFAQVQAANWRVQEEVAAYEGMLQALVAGSFRERFRGRGQPRIDLMLDEHHLALLGYFDEGSWKLAERFRAWLEEDRARRGLGALPGAKTERESER